MQISSKMDEMKKDGERELARERNYQGLIL